MAVGPAEFFAAGTVLFFFWVYGIVSFVLDVKNKFVPYLRRRRAADGADEDDEDETDDLEKVEQLY